jgi:hypothetical protein
MSVVCRATGPADAVAHAASDLARTCWVHWFDSIDLVVEGPAVSLRIGIHAQRDEWPVYEAFLLGWMRDRALVIDMEQDAAPPHDGLPDAVLKTSPEHAAELARSVGGHSGLSAVAVMARGVVHAHVAAGRDAAGAAAAVVARHAAELEAVGGDAHSRHLAPRPAAAAEVAWIDCLHREWGNA